MMKLSDVRACPNSSAIHVREPPMTELVKLHHSEAGQGLPVVLLHGFPLSSAIWRRQQQGLSDGYRVILPDLRGHGRSPAPAGVYEMEAMAADVFALLDSLDVKQAVILGHSMGGYVALAAWRLAPERFLGLGLIASHAAARHRRRSARPFQVGRQGCFRGE